MYVQPQQEGREDGLKKAFEDVETLTRRISQLQQQHRGRRLTTARDLKLWFLDFIWVELSGIVASQELMYSLPDYLDMSISYWLSLCRELSHIGERLIGSEQDILRRCHAQLHRAAAHCFSRHAGLPLPRLYQIQPFLEILTQIVELSVMYKPLRLDDDDDRNSRTSSSYAADAGGNLFLVGIEGVLRNKKLRWFMADRKENETVKIISMVGPAGVGKTTLAMEVYRQLRQIRGNCFQCCATAKVSQRSDIKELLMHILSQIHESPTLLLEASIERSQTITQEDKVLKLLAGNINQCLREKRYLVLIDNILKESDWNIIKNAFPQNSTGSRIIITTQLRSVAQFCCSRYDGLMHEVKPLSQLDSERLLFREAFGSEDGCPPGNLKRVCDDILERCEGIPLFISGMADWLKELQQRDRHHISSQNFITEVVPKLPRQFEQSLAIIYDDLPYHLKHFLSMSMFHGYMFDKYSDLIEKPVREGIFYYAGTDCFSELVDRNVITRVATTHEHTPQIEACTWQVNYFMLQFLASKSAGKAYFFTRGTVTSVVAEEIDSSQTRSLAICGTVEGIPHLDKFIYLRMLDLTGWQRFKEEDMVSICKMFLLQYLSLRNTGVSKLPPAIRNLQQLEILDISHTQISDLPSQVCELSLLKKLDLRSTPIRRLPEQIRNLQHLLHLLVGGDGVNRDDTVTEIPEDVGYIERLHTLATVDLSQCSPSLVEALRFAWRLKMLAIKLSFHQCTDGRLQTALRSSIEQWGQLESLTILCGLGCCMDFLDSLRRRSDRLQKFKVTGGRFATLPQWFLGLDRLTFIEITVCRLLPDDLGVLGNLPKLESFVLGLHFIPEAKIVIDGLGFQKLERLSVCCRVPWLTFMQGAMPVLTFVELKIAGSPVSQDSVPSGISNLLSLSDVAIHYNKWYNNCLNVQRTVEAVRKGVAEHRKPINLFINGIQEEYVEAIEEDSARATGSQSEIEAEG